MIISATYSSARLPIHPLPKNFMLAMHLNLFMTDFFSNCKQPSPRSAIHVVYHPSISYQVCHSCPSRSIHDDYFIHHHMHFPTPVHLSPPINGVSPNTSNKRYTCQAGRQGQH
jgi:hypothetical protein